MFYQYNIYLLSQKSSAFGKLISTQFFLSIKIFYQLLNITIWILIKLKFLLIQKLQEKKIRIKKKLYLFFKKILKNFCNLVKPLGAITTSRPTFYYISIEKNFIPYFYFSFIYSFFERNLLYQPTCRPPLLNIIDTLFNRFPLSTPIIENENKEEE